MIELPRPPIDLAQPRIKIFGIGNAGSNALDRIVSDGTSGMDLVAINTDAQVLTTSVAPRKLQIGQTITRGLGAGGDPDLGCAAAREGITEIHANLVDATIVFLVVGLGGGTGSGAAPVIAEVARDHGAMVVVVATLPFGFEGKRRLAQAEASLAELRQIADVLLCYENDRMGEAVAPNAPIQEAFAVADSIISESVRAMAAFAGRKGLVHTSFDELVTAFRGDHVRCYFGCGAATGDNRAHEALEIAFRNPLLNRAKLKEDADNIVVSICGGPDLTLNEVQVLMEEFQHHVSEETRVFFGATINPELTGRLTVSILASAAAATPVAPAAPAPPATQAYPSHRTLRARVATPQPAPEPEPEPVAVAAPEPEETQYPEAHGEEETAPMESVEEQEVESAPEPAVAPPVRPRPLFSTVRSAVPPSRPPLPARVPRPAKDNRAEQLPSEPVNRGRFEKSEPTIIDGQDLDVPTFLRRSLKH